jgi:hypothetical protein
MEGNRESIESPAELLRQLIAIFPDFAAYWDESGNMFLEDDGSFTYCGAFAELSHFVRDRFESLPPESLSILGQLLATCMAGTDPVLDECAATCFLENMTGEPCSKQFKSYLFGEPLQFFLQFGD